MQPFSKTVGDFEVLVHCRADLEAQARHVLQSLAAPGVELRDGLEVPIGWSTLYARADADVANRLVLHEPDFDGDAMTDRRPDVSCTLALHSTQLWLAKKARAPFSPTHYRQKVALAPRDCLGARRLSVIRATKPRFDDDSGWLVFVEGQAPVGQQAGEPEILHACELMKRRPALVQALCLPPGFLARFDGDTLEGIGRPE
jgi:hypothetical protein